jgi:hypothetical protein
MELGLKKMVARNARVAPLGFGDCEQTSRFIDSRCYGHGDICVGSLRLTSPSLLGLKGCFERK